MITERDINLEDDDAIYTQLDISDYGWMEYNLRITLMLANGTRMRLFEQYLGGTESKYAFEHYDLVKHDYITNVEIQDDSTLALNHMRTYMEEQIKQWDSENYFNNKDLAIDIMNGFLESELYTRKECANG